MRIRPQRRRLKTISGGFAAVLLMTSGIAVVSGLNTHKAFASGLTVNLRWSRSISCSGSVTGACGFVASAPNLADLDGQNDIVVGSKDGNVYAFDQSNGNTVAGWPVETGFQVESSPAVDPQTNDVYVGSGVNRNAGGPQGGYFAIAPNGTVRWDQDPRDQNDIAAAIASSPAIGALDQNGVADVIATALDLSGWAFDVNGNLLPGWPRQQTDTSFSSPALLDPSQNNGVSIIVGGDDSPGGLINHQGGIVQGLSGSGQVLWTDELNDTVDSSPAIDTTDGQTFVAVGDGDYYSRTDESVQSDATQTFLMNTSGQILHSWNTGAYTEGAPAFGDILGNGTDDVIQTTWGGGGGQYLQNQSAIGELWAWNPVTGATVPGFPVALPDVADGAGGTIGQAVTADFTGSGVPDIVVAGGCGADIYDAVTEQVLARLNSGCTVDYQNTPLIIDNHNGTLDVVIAGTGQEAGVNQNDSVISDYTISDPGETESITPDSWPMFRHDVRHTGSSLNPPETSNVCTAANTPGYWEVASDGGIFAQCSVFYGSEGGKSLNEPIVSGASTPNHNGYWEVASDGGIFSFNAPFYGSEGGHKLNAPIVGMAPDPATGGYWEVASDGGIFSFNAPFYGSEGGKPLNAPIIAMASTSNGGGYWLIASDGGIFSFGNAAFYGSEGGHKLNAPIVGMAPDPATGGYWEVASDGGIFSFNAPFYGSEGGHKLNEPIVGMANDDSVGYWLVASDGGIFSFGGAPFAGSTGGMKLNKPIITMAAAR